MDNNELQLFLKYNNIYTLQQQKEEVIMKVNDPVFKQHPNIRDNLMNNQWVILLNGTYACNLNCIYCINHKLREKYSQQIISKDILKQVIQKLGENISMLTFHGGESTLLPESLLEFAVLEKEKNNYHFNITLQTNGVALTEKRIQKLQDLNIGWGISFDGLFNDEQRGCNSTKAVLNLLAMDNRPPNIDGFITVYTKNNINKMIENYEYYKSLGIQYFQSSIVKENVSEGTNPFLVSNEIAIKEVLNYIKYWIHDMNPIKDLFITRHIEKILGNPTVCEDSVCIGRWLNIDMYGNIGFCGMDLAETNITNIEDINDYRDLLTHPKYLKYINAQYKLLEDNCSRCPWLHMCAGGCFASNYEMDNQYRVLNRRHCELVSEIAIGVLELIQNIDINDTNNYNPIFLNILKKNNYFSLTEIKEIETRYA